ncbi:MAG: hypothetical protein IIZ74_04660 [Erysipelotrichaceae bacterium]|nr:hypothetical protein [Erysipelotrichaceae bacterium]MBQ3384923.1 hypothetical protein [Erysipelotrichaceae bacterium]
MRNKLLKLGALVGLGVYLYKENTDTFSNLSYLVLPMFQKNDKSDLVSYTWGSRSFAIMKGPVGLISSLYETYPTQQGLIGPVFYNEKSNCLNMGIVDETRNEGYIVGFYGMSEPEAMLLAKTFKIVPPTQA